MCNILLMNIWSSNSNNICNLKAIGHSTLMHQDDVHRMGINTKMVNVDNEISRDMLDQINLFSLELFLMYAQM